MTISVKEKDLKHYLRGVLFEQIGPRTMAAGDKTTMGGTGAPRTYDKTAGTIDSTVPDEVPVQPTEMMATQLATERPPVEDDSFVPTNVEQLSKAADILTKNVPASEIDKFYSLLKNLVNDTIEGSREPELSGEPPGMAEKMPVDAAAEEDQDLAVESKLRENEWDEDEWDGPGMAVVDYFGEDGEDEEYQEPVPETPEGTSLEDLAPLMGKSGPSGARQEIERILQRLEFMSDNLSPADLAKLQSRAGEEFVALLEDGGFIESDEAEEMLASPKDMNELDSFRFFFVNVFVLPAYREIKRSARKRVEAEIDKLDIPKKSRQTILNQALGETPRSPQKLAQKITKDALQSGYSDEDAVKIIQKIQDSFATLQKLSEPAGDLGSAAIKRWDSLSPKRRQDALEQAIESTLSYQEDFGV